MENSSPADPSADPSVTPAAPSAAPSGPSVAPAKPATVPMKPSTGPAEPAAGPGGHTAGPEGPAGPERRPHGPDGPDRPDGSDGPDGSSAGADTALRMFLAGAVLLAGLAVFLIGPLLAVACGSCQDGVRSVRLEGVLLAIRDFAVPITVITTLIGVFAARHGGRAGCAGLGALGLLLAAMVLVARV
ncbi:hypothetical protein ABT354_21000 [Streptomyces sp. NPDC000594]|uniref:hypothetical protein n=1 Tax=Streptomyces sp. NPDC000594 TaxID=3154261 RepID=UPI00333110D5